MDAVTYPDKAVVEEINEHFVPAKLLSADSRDLTRGFNVRWLPGLVVTDSTKRLHSQTIGFLPPQDLLCELTFGRAMAAFAWKDYDGARDLLLGAAERWPENPRAPEALFWVSVIGVRREKAYDKDVVRRIVTEHPTSQWRQKVEYQLDL